MNLAERILKQTYREITYKEVTFKVKKIDAFEMQNIYNRVKKGNNAAEVEILLNCIISATGIKVKDCVDSVSGFTADELDSEIPNDKELIKVYLGKNTEAVTAINEVIVEEVDKFNNKTTEQKKN